MNGLTLSLESLRACPSGRQRQRPGIVRSTAVAGMACSAALAGDVPTRVWGPGIAINPFAA